MVIKIDIRQLDQKKQNPVVTKTVSYTLGQTFEFEIAISIYPEDTYLVEGTSSFVKDTECSKCLERCNLNENITFRDLYVKHQKDLLIFEESFEGNVFFAEDSVIDLSLSIEAAFAESAMHAHLCDQACKGLCEVCGVNRNEKDCTCAEEIIDPRLEALKNLKF